jgi:hypothetical protein
MVTKVRQRILLEWEMLTRRRILLLFCVPFMTPCGHIVEGRSMLPSNKTVIVRRPRDLATSFNDPLP